MPGGLAAYGYAPVDNSRTAARITCGRSSHLLEFVPFQAVAPEGDAENPYKLVGDFREAYVEDFDEYAARVRIVIPKEDTAFVSAANYAPAFPSPADTALPSPDASLLPPPSPAAAALPSPDASLLPILRSVPRACPLTALETQLDGSASQAFDAGRAVAVMELDYATCGQIRVSTEAIGRRMGVPDGATTTADRKRAVESYADRARSLGLVPPRYRAVERGKVSDLWDLLIEGRPASVIIDYGQVGDQRGDSSYDGFHVVWLRWARERDDGTKEVCVYDPLADGRSAEVPDGPQWWPWQVVESAVSAVSGPGLWDGGRVEAPASGAGAPDSRQETCGS